MFLQIFFFVTKLSDDGFHLRGERELVTGDGLRGSERSHRRLETVSRAFSARLSRASVYPAWYFGSLQMTIIELFKKKSRI